MGYRYYTPSEIEQIIEMLKQSYTIRKIAKVYKPRAEYIKKEKNRIVISKLKRAELIIIHSEKLKKVFENTFKQYK